jgi:hypothetical protein
MDNSKKDDFYKKFNNISKVAHNFSISAAIMSMLETNTELNVFVKGNFELGVNFATRAWNLALINDKVIISLLLMPIAKALKAQIKKPQKQVEAMLWSLIELKQKLYPDVYRLIADYSTKPDANGNPYLRVVSGQDETPEHFTEVSRAQLFGEQKYGWVSSKN